MIRLNKAGTSLEIGDVLGIKCLQDIAARQNNENYNPSDVVMWLHRESVRITEDGVDYKVKIKVTPDFEVKVTGLEVIEPSKRIDSLEELLRLLSA